MRVLVAQLSPVVGDVAGNAALCRAAVEEARRRGCALVVMPELALSGYPPRDLLERRDLVRACRRAADEVAATTANGGPIAVFGLPWRDGEGRLRNAAAVARDGRVEAVVFKTLLPTYDVFDEARWFAAETSPRPVEVGGLRLGVTVCEDLWRLPGSNRVPGASQPAEPPPVDPVDRLAGRCDLVVNLSASPFHAGKGAQRLDLLRAQVRRLGAPLVYCNLVGGNDELLFDGDSLALAPDGRLLAQGPAFEPGHVVVETAARSEVAFRRLPFEEEVVRALEMGIRDYVARCGFSEVVLGLSGGVDSALVATLAARALGAERVWTVGMPGPYSSEGSVTDARELARRLGTRFDLVPIDGIFEAYRGALAPVWGPGPQGVAEENLQARARGTVLMALSNRFGHLLLTTGNKSELAVGYATLYGDMNGGLAVISDVFKTDVYRLARWLNRDEEVVPRAILDKPPSAELRPDQTDQDTLPPYEVLDAILRLYVEGMVDPEDIAAQGHDPDTVRRVVRMVVGAEYKRWQAPPGLRVSVKAFGSGRRIPLAQRWHLA